MAFKTSEGLFYIFWEHFSTAADPAEKIGKKSSKTVLFE